MKNSRISRRRFLGTTAAAAAAFAIIPLDALAIPKKNKKPNSKVGGVQLGCTTYSYRSMPHKVDEIIPYLLLAGINQIELRSVAEEDLGLPSLPPRPRGQEVTEKEKADYAKAAQELREKQRQWRLSLPMSRYEDMRRKFNSAGIKVNIAKLTPSSWSDEEIDYAYNAAKTLGAIGITDEYSDMAIKRLGIFAEKHHSLAMYHTHQQPAEPGFSFDTMFIFSGKLPES